MSAFVEWVEDYCPDLIDESGRLAYGWDVVPCNDGDGVVIDFHLFPRDSEGRRVEGESWLTHAGEPYSVFKARANASV
jgi:hypothetical protein